MKRIVREVWRLLYPVLIYFVVAFIVELGILLIFSRGANGAPALDEDGLVSFISSYSLQITAVTNGILIPIYLFLLMADKKKYYASGGKKYAAPAARNYLIMAVFGMAAAVSVNVIVSISGLAYFSPKYQEVSEIIYSGSLFMELISAVIAAPVAEELLFRGMIYQRLRGYCKPACAILASAGLFGIFHGNLVQFVYAFLIGCILAYVYEKFKTIWAPVVFHVGANFLSVIITEFVPERYMTVLNILLAMIVCIAITAVSLKYVMAYQPEERNEVKSV